MISRPTQNQKAHPYFAPLSVRQTLFLALMTAIGAGLMASAVLTAFFSAKYPDIFKVIHIFSKLKKRIGFFVLFSTFSVIAFSIVASILIPIKIKSLKNKTALKHMPITASIIVLALTVVILFTLKSLEEVPSFIKEFFSGEASFLTVIGVSFAFIFSLLLVVVPLSFILTKHAIPYLCCSSNKSNEKNIKSKDSYSPTPIASTPLQSAPSSHKEPDEIKPAKFQAKKQAKIKATKSTKEQAEIKATKCAEEQAEIGASPLFTITEEVAKTKAAKPHTEEQDEAEHTKPHTEEQDEAEHVKPHTKHDNEPPHTLCCSDCFQSESPYYSSCESLDQ